MTHVDDQLDLKKIALHDLWAELDAKMTPFAGYAMPVQFPMGVLKEHLHTRSRAGLFDVSHMGQAVIETAEASLGSPEAHECLSAALETLTPSELKRLKPGALRYSVLLNGQGGVLDDLMITRPAEPELQGRLMLVVNAGVKDADYAFLNEKLEGRARLSVLDGRSLLALQGPSAARVLAQLAPLTEHMPFMTSLRTQILGSEVDISRSGYTGEDGFEISLPDAAAEGFARALLEDEDVAPIGLGARDSLRLEAGLCLYGHDMTEETSPVEATIEFAKRRREEGGLPGAERILGELRDGPSRRRVGLQPEGRAPASEGAEILDEAGRQIGQVTSGGFGPSVGGPVAMGYVEAGCAEPGAAVALSVRGKALPARVVDLPFVQHNYYRG